ncbi:MAG: molecular chaperone DnaJ [Chloroflexi bacterium]|nr:MAG: molecular chaperone DnaJ [Chloroflexota bacterium]
MTAKRDYYEVLGVSRDATKDEIRRAYRRKAKQYHPDVNDAPDAAERFREIKEAYEVLSDDEKRAMYDRFGHNADQFSRGFGGFSDFGIDDLFSEFFGFGTRARTAARRAPVRGNDLRVDITLEFEEAVFGTEKELEIPRWETCDVCGGTGAEPGTRPITCPQCGGAGEVRHAQQTGLFGSFVTVVTCPRCQGTGEVITTPCSKCRGRQRVHASKVISVEIPPGVDEGTRIRLTGEGDAGERGGPPGNLYVNIHVKPHEFFERRDNDIYLELPLNIAQAALGDEVKVPTLDGEETLRIPPGTQTGQTFRLRGKGVPYLRREGRGDQVVRVFVVTPTNLNEHQKQLLRELSKTLGREVIPQRGKNFMDWLKDAFGV